MAPHGRICHYALRPEAEGDYPVSDDDKSTLWTRLREDFNAHGRDVTRPGLHALLVHRFGVWRMTLQPRPLRMPFSALYRAMFTVVRNVYGIEVPDSVRVGRRVVFEHQGGIVVHGATVIGDECIIRQGVTLGLRNMQNLQDAPTLGRGVSVGAGAKVLGKVRVGDGADIGANAVVLHDVPAGALAVGIPARVVARRPRGQPSTQPLVAVRDTDTN
jgi:serine O-acetyltransferase